MVCDTVYSTLACARDRCGHALRADSPLLFRMYKSDCRLVRDTLQLAVRGSTAPRSAEWERHVERHAVQGFKHTSSDNFNVLWSGASVKASRLASLHPHQRVNHFPKSHEITRKDRLCANLSRMRAKVRDAARSGKRIEWSIVGWT